LEREARRRKLSLSAVLDLAVLAWLDKNDPDSGSGYANVCDVEITANALIDTGAILALLDRNDDWHRLCVEAFRQTLSAADDFRGMIDGFSVTTPRLAGKPQRKEKGPNQTASPPTIAVAAMRP
jgi:hypothetical protein